MPNESTKKDNNVLTEKLSKKEYREKAKEIMKKGSHTLTGEELKILTKAGYIKTPKNDILIEGR